MKEATGELNMTLVTVLAVAAILAFVTLVLPNMINGISNKWGNPDTTICTQYDENNQCIDNGRAN